VPHAASADPPRWRRHLATCVVVAAGLCSIGMFYALNRTWQSRYSTDQRVLAHLANARVEVVTGHLWLEEWLTGDETVNPDAALQYFDTAAESVTDCRGTGVASNDRFEAVAAQISDFGRSARERIESGVGAPEDRAFDAEFEALLQTLIDLSDLAAEDTQRARDRQSFIASAMVAIWAGVLAVMPGVLVVLEGRRARAQSRVTHLNAILRAIRNVNQLIVLEPDRSKLLQGACDCLVETRGYGSAWIANTDESGKIRESAAATTDGRPGSGDDWLRDDRLPPCRLVILGRGGVVPIDAGAVCGECRRHAPRPGWAAMGARLERSGTVYGVMCVQLPPAAAQDAEEQSLFEEVAGDLALALELIETEEQRKRAEEDLRHYARQLERSNRELQDFAYVASHDLQEPLRKIQAFGGRLEEKYAEALEERGRDYLDRMRNAAERMQALINDLLAFSRVTSRGQPFEPTDLSETVAGVLAALEVAIAQAGAKIDVQPLPTVNADPTQMRQLVQNLVSNSLKFHQVGRAPNVRIYAEVGDQVEENERDAALGRRWCRLHVEDDGIGFDQKHADRVFTVFEQLHGRGEYPGTGVGLAICRKIAERHGGTIAARSAPGEGATFVVTLPVA